MRIPEQAVLPRPRLLRRYQLVILLFVAAAIAALILVQLAAEAYTNYLWFGSLHLSVIWRSVAETRAGLAAVFTGTFFVACWTTLWAADRLAPLDIYVAPEYELARRYGASFGRFRLGVRTLVSFLLALVVGLGTSGQWQHWMMFVNGGNFGTTDPQFHRDIGFFVFRLPFLSFLVDWSLVALVVLFIVTAIAYYLNGGLRTTGPAPRIDHRVTAHLSLILALLALVRAAAYVFVDRFDLDLSTNGLVVGAGYTDVHVRLPALSILAIVSMIAFVLLTYNIYYRSWALPAVAVGIWAFVALSIGMIYPAIVQWLQVNPSQAKLELPYVKRNIAGTRAAYGLSDVTQASFEGSGGLKADTVEANAPALSALPLWDPTVAGVTYDVLQALRGYYHLAGLSTDRYMLGEGARRTLTPVVIGTRELELHGEPRRTWVAEHLRYTHGYGVVLSPANATGSAGRPQFDISGVPEKSTGGAPVVGQRDIYFGDSPSSYVVTDTKEPELDYVAGGQTKTSHYHGSGGVKLTGFWQRAAFAVRFRDVGLLDSSLITKRSRLIFDQNVRQLVAKAAPFLKVDSNPYPVIAGGRVYWMVSCYTTADTYPYSEGAATGVLGPKSGLQGDYNYIRNSVEAVVNAYSGKVSFFALRPHEPVLAAWERVYPGLVQPLSAMEKLSPQLRQHLRFPQALLMVLSAMYGRYHYTPSQAVQFYDFDNAWSVAEGNRHAPYVPTYELVRLPGHLSTQFVDIEPLVPQSATGRAALLSAFLVGDSSYQGYGRITAYVLPQPSEVNLGPELVGSRVQLIPAIGHEVALLRREKARVLYGPPELVPIDDSVIYVQSIYISSNNRSMPVLDYVAADFAGNKVGFGSSLQAALQQVFGRSLTGVGPATNSSLAGKIEADLGLAYSAYQRSLSDGKHFRLGALQKDLAVMGRYLKEAHRLLAKEQGSDPASKSTPAGKKTTVRSEKTRSSSTRGEALTAPGHLATRPDKQAA